MYEVNNVFIHVMFLRIQIMTVAFEALYSMQCGHCFHYLSSLKAFCSGGAGRELLIATSDLMMFCEISVTIFQ